MGSSHGIGVKRNDYHRRNRRRNISMHNTSRGNNVGVGHLERIANTLVVIPQYERDELIKRASTWESNPRASVETACVNYLRHATPYDELRKAGRMGLGLDVGYFFTLKKVHDAIAEAYPWLARECELQFLQKRDKVRLVKQRERSPLTALHVEEFNAREEATAAGETADAEDGGTGYGYDGALSSLDSSRLLYFPPFLKPEDVRTRRFGDHETMNDRWWEWERELKISRFTGRPYEYVD
jgi:hypothetical protein